MKRTAECLVSLACVLFLAACNTPADTAEEIYYALEIRGSLVGYSEIRITPGDAETPREISSKVLLKLTALGQDFDFHVRSLRKVDPETDKTLFIDYELLSGTMKQGATFVFGAGEVVYTPKTGGSEKTISLDPDVIVDDEISYPYLVEEMGEGKAEKKTFRVLDLTQGEIHEKDFTRKGRESLVINNKEYDCLVFDSIDRKTGVAAKFWIDPRSARVVRTEASNGVVSILSDSAVKERIERGDIDEMIIEPVDTAIADFQSITFMKIEARIRTLGEWVTAESLNVPGQAFAGTVENNLIDGLFLVEHERYDGAGAPPFPPGFDPGAPAGDGELLKKYLEPENMVESDDPELIEKARELTEGSKDCWEAARRLSEWVAGEIAYKIPGGSARQTYDEKTGECASHSRLLAAFCRAVGIPARLATGCMYTPRMGGSFGQHVWNEIYMGEAGWIPVDSTANEIDYVDSGHIRLGNLTSFDPVEMKVVDFKAGSLEMGQEPAGLGAVEKMPWEKGRTYTYKYFFQGKILGTDSFTLKSFEKGEDGGYTCATKLDLDGKTASSEWKLDQELFPLSYKLQGKAGDIEYSYDCEFSEGRVVEKAMRAGKPVEKTIPLDEKIYLIDNNNLSFFAFLLTTIPLDEGETRAFKIFHPMIMQVLPVQVAVKGTETIAWCGKEVECRFFEVNLAGSPLKMWVDREGRLLKESESNGALVVELVSTDGVPAPKSE